MKNHVMDRRLRAHWGRAQGLGGSPSNMTVLDKDKFVKGQEKPGKLSCKGRCQEMLK